MTDYLNEILSGGSGVAVGGGVVWYVLSSKIEKLIDRKLKPMSDDIKELKELAVNDKLQDQKLEEVNEKLKSHHRRIGGHEVKQNALEVQLAVMSNNIEAILKIVEKFDK